MKIPLLETYFGDAIKSKLLMYEVDTTYDNTWLAVYYKENMGYEPNKDGSKWSLLCSQSLKDYQDADGNLKELRLINRITLMLAENLRSARQDVNGLLKEGK